MESTIKTRQRTQQEKHAVVPKRDYRTLSGMRPSSRTAAEVATANAAKLKAKTAEEKKKEARLEKLTEIESKSYPTSKKGKVVSERPLPRPIGPKKPTKKPATAVGQDNGVTKKVRASHKGKKT